MTRVLLYIDICEDVRRNNWTLRVNEFCIGRNWKGKSKLWKRYFERFHSEI